MMKKMRIAALLLALVMVFALTACKDPAGPDTDSPQVSDQPTDSPTQNVPEQPTNTPDTSEQPTGDVEQSDKVNLAVLSGPTGIGAAKLLHDADQAADGAARYNYTIATDNSELVAGLSNGEFDIATVASNVALNLYNKTGGQVKIIALGTLGVLHILEGSGGTAIESIADLEGETIYSAGAGANPEYILRHLLTMNDIDPDEDVELVFADAAEIQAKLLSGEIKYAMLPVPAATAAIIKGAGEVRAAIDVTEAWNELYNGSQLIMTAVVARTEFIEEHPEAVDAFLQEYAASIDYVNNNIEAAAEIIAGYGITPNAAIAKQAIPQCHLVCITGADMAPAISDYYRVLYSVNPASVGGGLPDDAIYYVP